MLDRITNIRGENITEFVFNGTFVDYEMTNQTNNWSKNGDYNRTQVVIINRKSAQ